MIACRREISLDQSVLSQIDGIALVAAAEGEQEAAEGLLLTLYVDYEFVACHGLHLCGQTSFLGLYLLGEHLFAQTVVDEKGNADC